MAIENELTPDQRSRREALKWLGKGALVVAAVTTAPQIFNQPSAEAEGMTDKFLPDRDSLVPDFIPQAFSVVEPFVLSEAYGGIQFLTAPVLRRLRLPIGTHVSEEKVRVLSRAQDKEILDKGFIYGVLYNMGIWLSDAISAKMFGNAGWGTKIVMSGIIGLSSNAIYKRDPDRPAAGMEPEYMSGWRVPAFQILDNLVYWQLMEKYGFPSSTVARLLKDLSVLYAGKYLYRYTPNLVSDAVMLTASPQSVDDLAKVVINRSLHGEREN